MGWLRRSLDFAIKSDAVVSWGERVGWLLVWGLSTGTFTSIAGIAIGWSTDNLVYGLVIGVLGGLLVLGGFAVKAVRIAFSAPATASATTAPTTSQHAPTGTDSHQAQEVEIEQLEALEKEVEGLRTENRSLKAVNEGQQERLSEWDGNRRRFKQFLVDAWTEGINLRGNDPSKEEALGWESRVRHLLEQAVGEEIADDILRHDPKFESGDFDASDAQKFLEMRLPRVDRLKNNVAKHDAIPFRSGFDPYEWKDWKSPPQDLLGEQDASQQRPGYWENRQMLHAALKDFWAEANYLDNEDAYSDDEVKQWEDRTAQLILEALGQERVNDFLTNDDRIPGVRPDDSPRRAWVKHRQAQLGILIQVVDSLCTLEIRPDFDGRKWVGSEQFRFKQGTGY